MVDDVRVDSENERISRELAEPIRLTGPWYGRVAEITARWLTAQTFTNVLLVMVLFGGGYTAVKLVPVHLDQIQRGYTNVINDFRETLMKDRLAERELIKKMDDDHRQEREFLYQMIQSKKVVAQ